MAASSQKKKGSCEMSAHWQKVKCQFSKRKMLTRLSGKYNFISELFNTGRMLLDSRIKIDFIFMVETKKQTKSQI